MSAINLNTRILTPFKWSREDKNIRVPKLSSKYEFKICICDLKKIEKIAVKPTRIWAARINSRRRKFRFFSRKEKPYRGDDCCLETWRLTSGSQGWCGYLYHKYYLAQFEHPQRKKLINSTILQITKKWNQTDTGGLEYQVWKDW